MSRQEDSEKEAMDYCEDHSHCIYFEAGAEYGYQYALQHPQWIPVEEELPKEDGRYWCCDDDGGQEELKWSDGHWYGLLDPYPIEGITHWMPIVPPRKEE